MCVISEAQRGRVAQVYKQRDQSSLYASVNADDRLSLYLPIARNSYTDAQQVIKKIRLVRQLRALQVFVIHSSDTLYFHIFAVITVA